MKKRVATIALLALLSAGCMTRFYDHREFTLDAGEISTLVIDAVASQRTVSISGTTTGGTVDVFVYLEENQEEAERLITLDRAADATITAVENATDFSLTASIPPDKAAVVMVRAAAPEEVAVELTMSD